MNKVTVDQVMNLEPCPYYTRELVIELWNGQESLSLKEILDLDINMCDRSWVLARLVPTEILPKWARHCADKAKEWTAAAAYEADSASMAADSASRAAYWAARAAKYAADASKYAAAYSATRAANNATIVAYWTAVAAKHSRKNHEETLKELLNKLIEMSEEIDEA